jgi:hypothetical protein
MAAVHLNAGDLLHGKVVGGRIHRGGGAKKEIAVGDHVPARRAARRRCRQRRQALAKAGSAKQTCFPVKSRRFFELVGCFARAARMKIAPRSGKLRRVD